MKDTLVLVNDSTLYMFPSIKSDNIDICNVYKKMNKVEVILRKILWRLGLDFALYYETWAKQVFRYKKIVIFDAAYDIKMAKFIIKKSKNSAKFIYMWNPVKKGNVSMKKYDEVRDYFSIFSYDKNNCAQYNLKYNSMVYSKDVILPNNSIIYDVIFLGYAKDRLEYIENIYNLLSSQDLVCEFYIVGDSAKKQVLPIQENRLNYEQYLELISKSRAILDVVQKEQSGLSLRTLEAVFFNKKLITNNKEILKYDIYHPNNIFVIENDDISQISNFLDLPYKNLEKEIVKRYEFNEWIKKFN